MSASGDYISREAVLALTDDYELTLDDDEIFFEYIDPKKVAALPAADVRPAVKAHWEDDWEMGCSGCSSCGEDYLWEDFNGVEEWNFCPNCGADMRGESE